MQRRQGFTLVELLVAMALIVFMMVILSEAFSVGLDSFRRLKAIGDMNARMRTTFIALQGDLRTDHFDGARRLSDPNFWNHGPPTQGFFRIYHGGPLVVEDLDSGGDQIPSTRAVNHVLHFTTRKRGNEMKDFFRGSVPTGSPLLGLGKPESRYQERDPAGNWIPPLTSQWAEVAYFLRSNQSTAGSTPLYALYRRHRLLVPVDEDVNRTIRIPSGAMRDYLEVSCIDQGGNLYFNGPMDITIPQRRLGMDPAVAANGGVIDPNPNYGGMYPRMEDDVRRYSANPDLTSADLLVPDVISFEVTVLLANAAEFVDLYHSSLQPFSQNNPRFTGNPRVYDTWTLYKDEIYDYSQWDQPGLDTSIPLYQDNATPPNQIRIMAVKITLRVWDVKTQQARQVTLIQDM